MPSQPSSKAKVWRKVAIRLSGSALILATLFYFLPVRQLWSTLEHIPPALSIGLLFFYLGLHFLGVAKWRILINVAGADLTFLQAARCYYLGLFGNNFLPSLIGGDFVRASLAFTMSKSRTAIVLGSLIDRVQDVIGLLAVAGIGALMVPMALNEHSRRIFVGIALLLVVVGAMGVGSLFVIPVRRLPMKLRRIMVQLRRGIRSVSKSPGSVALCFCMGVVLQSFQIAINFPLAEASGLHLPLYAWLYAWPLAKLSSLLPVTQGGIGVREAALVALLVPLGAPSVLTLAVGLVFEAITIVGGLIAGFMAFVMSQMSGGKSKLVDPAAGTTQFAKKIPTTTHG
jgi:uncharacterized protein (TIRG00374 family)